MMPDDISSRACRDGERVDAHTIHGSQPGWMSHWMHTTCKSGTAIATPARSRLSVGCEVKEFKEDSSVEKRDLLDLLGGSEVAMDSSIRVGGFGEAAGVRKVAFMDEAETGISKKTSFVSKSSFPELRLSRKLNGILSSQGEERSVFREDDGKSGSESCSRDDNVSLNRAKSHMPSTSAPPKTETLVKELQLLSQGVQKNSQCAVEQKNLTVSSPVWNDFLKSASGIVPTNGLDKGKSVVPQFKDGPHEVYLASQEHYMSTKSHNYTSLFISEKKVSTLVNPQRSPFSRWVQGDVAHFPRDTIAGSDDGLFFVCDQQTKVPNYIANPNITNKATLLESTKSQNFYGVSSMIARVPCSVHDVETTKIYTSIDSVEELPRGHPKISQTTHHFLMSKKTDANLSERGQFFKELVTPVKFKGNTFNGILDLSPPMSECAMDGLKLETIGSSKKNEGKENVQEFRCPPSLANESSAETDTMDIDALHENNLPGEVPSQTNKCSKDSQNSHKSQVETTNARGKTIVKSVNTALPDINIEPQEVLALPSPVVDRETSTSRTHSLDVEQLFSHADEHGRSKSSSDSLGPDPCSRWVKRLKLCTLDSAHGTKSETIGETSSREKVSDISRKVTENSKTSLEVKMVDHAEGETVPNPSAAVLSNSQSSFTEAKKTVEITLTHPWIQRWKHNQGACSKKRNELAELHEPKSSNIMLEEFQKKQFPSIGAMALMGKAMNSLNPSELTKKGPVIVWNTKGF